MQQARAQTELVVALDYPTTAEAEKLIETLTGSPVIYKVGSELFLNAGPEWVRKLTSNGARVFLDLKFHDIPNTVGQAVLQSAHLGAEFVTIHLVGGKPMLDEIDTRLQEALLSGQIKSRPKVLGVSVLTSFREEDWIANMSLTAKLGSARTIEDAVMHFATLANDHPGVDGMVCSPKEIDPIRLKFPNLLLMVPGIRPKGVALHDQSRVTTPGEASVAGASYIVVGRPITQAPDPKTVVDQIIQELL